MAAGHEVGHHGYLHRGTDGLDAGSQRTELEEGLARLAHRRESKKIAKSPAAGHDLAVLNPEPAGAGGVPQPRCGTSRRAPMVRRSAKGWTETRRER